MPYVYDYVTEEEFYKYKLNEFLSYYPKYEKYCAKPSIDRERDSLLLETHADRDSFGQNKTYIFIYKNISFFFSVKEINKYIDSKNNEIFLYQRPKDVTYVASYKYVTHIKVDYFYEFKDLIEEAFKVYFDLQKMNSEKLDIKLILELENIA